MNFIINQSPLECGSPSLEVTLKLGAIKGEPQKKGGINLPFGIYLPSNLANLEPCQPLAR